MKKFLAIATIFLFLGAGCTNQNNRVSTNNTSTTLSYLASSISFSFSADGSYFDIKKDGANIKRITAKDIPVFDTNYEGGAVDPGKDYAFDYSTFDDADAHKPVYDKTRNQVYFMVFNQTTAANVNADRALFSYNIDTDKLELIKKEEMSSSFNDVFLSPDSTYLVFSDGSHGGACENINGLVVFDLNKNKEVTKLFLSSDKTGDVTFEKWNDEKSFVYKEEILKAGIACADITNEDWITNEKTYTIPQ